MKQTKTILVTGASGFIGSAMAAALRREGYEVREFAGDVRSPEDWEKQIVEGVVVLQLAGVRSETDIDFAVNAVGTQNLFRAAAKTGRLPAKVVFGSSQAVYMGCRPPFSELDRPKPTTVYGKSKLAAERAAIEAGKHLTIPVVVLRYSTVLGPGIRKESGMSGPLVAWVQAGLSGKPIRVHQDGKQTRDYIHINDAVAANLLAVERLPAGVYNVGGARPIRLAALAEWVRRATGGSSTIEIAGGKASAADPRAMVSDSTKLRSFGWKPERSAKQAVEEYVRGRQQMA
jgi:nucleoside-diphosphate-sugar epimerase